MQPTLISEYPSISIDDFREKEEHRIDHYFLTHCHTDHLCGINRETLQKKVYCTEETKNILLNHPSNFRQIRHKLIEILPVDQPKIFKLRTGEDILVTCLTANHCPGSIMILIEGSQGNVLFTGDTRLERPFVRRLKKNPHLSGKPIRTLYCDTTFAQPHLSEFPLKAQSMNSLIRFIDSYSVDTHFYLTANLVGHELILEEIYRQFGERISVTPEHMKWLKYVPQKSNRFASIGDICSLDDTRTRFHAGKYIQVNLDTLPGTSKKVKIKFCTQFFARRDCIPTTFDRNDAMVIPDVNSNDDNYKCLFSFHSSFNEIREFVEWLQPGYFKPFVFTETKEIKENEQCETRYVDYVGYFKDFCCEDIRRQWKQDDDWNLYAKPRTSIKARLLQSLFPEDDKSHETSEQRIHTDNVPVPKDSFIQVSLAVDSITSPFVPAKSNIEVTSVENQPTSLPSAVIATPRRLLSPSMTTNSPASDDTIINTPSPSKRSPIPTSLSRRTSSTSSFSSRHLSPSLFAPVKYVCLRDNSMINWEENDRNEKIQRARIHNMVARQVKKRRRRIQQGDEDYWEFNSLI